MSTVEPLVADLAAALVVNQESPARTCLPPAQVKRFEAFLRSRSDEGLRSTCLHIAFAGWRLRQRGLHVAAEQLFALAHLGLSVAEVEQTKHSLDVLRKDNRKLHGSDNAGAKPAHPKTRGVGFHSRRGKKFS